MGNVCGAFWPIAKRHMAQADAQAQELSALTLQNDVEGPAGTLLSLPPELLQRVMEFLMVVDDVHEAERVTKLVRSAARFVLTRGRWRPVKFVAEHGTQLILAAGRVAQDRGASTPAQRDVPASSLALCRAAWAVDPNETLRILFTYAGGGRKRAALLEGRLLALIEPSLDGLERIVRLLEPAHRFVYAKTQLIRWDFDTESPSSQGGRSVDGIRWWAKHIGTPITWPWVERLAEHHNLVVGYVSGALQSWTDAAVAVDFFRCFFGRHYQRPVPDLGDFTRGWGERKASAFAAAYAADVAAEELSGIAFDSHGFGGGQDFPTLPGKVRQVEEILHLEHRVDVEHMEQYDTSWEEEYLLEVKYACRFPGDYY